HGDPAVLMAMLRFAVHDLGSLGIGALLIYRPDAEPGPFVEERLPSRPPLPKSMAPLSSTPTECCASSAYGSFRVSLPKRPSTPSEVLGTRRVGATAMTTPFPPL